MRATTTIFQGGAPEAAIDATRRAPRTPEWERGAISFSLANLCCLRIWAAQPPNLTTAAESFLTGPYPIVHYAALFVTETLLAGLIWFWLGWTGSSRKPVRILVRTLGVVLFVLICGYNIRSQFIRFDLPLITWSPRRFAAAPLASLSCVFVLGFILYRAGATRLIRGIRGLLVVLCLSAGFNVLAAAWSIARTDHRAWIAPATASKFPAGGSRARRVVFVLFDEWDQRLTFDARDKSLKLDEFDRFRAESLYATHAMQPGPGTQLSIPSITTGEKADELIVKGPHSLFVKTGDGVYDWQKMDTIFARARALGMNVGLVGWYLPYCRVFASSTVDCWNWPWTAQSFPARSNFLDAFTTQVKSIVETDRFSPWGRSVREIETYRGRSEELEYAVRAAADRTYGFVYMHLPMTHAPFYYSRATKAFGTLNNTPDGYLSALAWADTTLGTIRQAMQISGVWNDTTVILTADHALRSAALGGNGDRRVPFLIRTAGHSNHLVVDRPFNTRILKDLMTGLFDGQIASQSDIRELLEKAPDGK